MREHLAVILKLHLKSVLGIKKRWHKMIKSLIPTEHQEQSLVVNKAIKHGLCKHPLYTAWHNMKRRIKGKDHQSITYYSDKGICEEWLNDFKAFYNWSIMNGWQDGLSIDRIDSNLGYSIENTVLCCQSINYMKNDYSLKDFNLFINSLQEALKQIKP